MRLKLKQLLDDLKFRGMADALDTELDRSLAQELSYEDLLYNLLSEEHRTRQERAMTYRLKQAKLPRPWSLETFPFDKQPLLDRARIRSLENLDFITRPQNVVFMGTPGTGKTGLAIGLARKALHSGYRVRFYYAQELLDELYASLADRATSRLLQRLAGYDLLVIDELGYLSIKPEQANAFFRLMELRYEHRATIITTNLEFPKWYDVFKRKTLVDALLDRIRHHCVTIRIDGPSLRVPSQAEMARKEPPTQDGGVDA